MAQDKVFGSRTPKIYNRDNIPGVKFDTATQLGIVKDNLSPGRDGRLRIYIPDFGGDENNPQMWRTVNYASPYAGSTYQPATSQNNNFTGTGHSYGMWMVPPDIGNFVLCTFVNGDPERGFWFACVPNLMSNWMVPGIAAGNQLDRETASLEIKAKLLPEDGKNPKQFLPVTEFNENVDGAVNSTFYNNKKPIHEEQAAILFQQGLDRDKTRGAISSSSQRETPSHVFGISTPGRPVGKDPAEDQNYAAKLAAGDIPADQYSVHTRKGGHTFVMDDGDASGIDQLIRLRTAGGHQLLMNDDQKIIYVGHKDGSTWVEIGEYGVNIYTAGALNVRAEQEMNFHSDGDINFQSWGGNINMDSATATNITSGAINIGGSESVLVYGAKTNIGGSGITVTADGKLQVSGNGGTVINGNGVDINGAATGEAFSSPIIPKNNLPDSGIDQDTKLWTSIPKSVETIVNTMPAHEPWTRSGIVAALAKTVQSSICPPRTGSPPTNYAFPAKNSNKLDRGTVKGQSAGWTTDTAFLDKIKSISSALNLNYIDMLACMNLETGRTFDPAITNSLGYTGLIQFGEHSGARLVGTTTAALREMDRVTQCDYVKDYFVKNKLTTKAPTPRLVDIYLTILWPAAVGRPDDYVIFPAGSSQYRANHGFDPGGTVGYITVGMVATSIATHLNEVKQALANAGVAGPGQVSSGSGTVITDGSGNPITSGASSTTMVTEDQGIIKSIGKDVEGETCPVEKLNDPDTFNPSSGIGSTPILNQGQVKAMIAELGYFESELNASKVNGDRIGKYQVDAAYLAKAGYVKTATSTLSSNVSWTGFESISSQEDFFSHAAYQDILQFNEFKSNYDLLLVNGGIKAADDICTASGMLFVAHQFRSVELAKKWRDTNEGTDSLGLTGDIYFNQGRYAIDVLYATSLVNNATTASSNASGEITPNETGIEPNDVFIFAASGTGTRDNFDHLSTTFKSAILNMAKAFKDKTGAKITITSAYRSSEDQDRIYNSWVAAGGHIPDKPTAGGITTPARPKSMGGKGSPHNEGAAIDSGQCPTIARTLDLAQYGLRWGGTFTKPDAVHIQLANVTP